MLTLVTAILPSLTAVAAPGENGDEAASDRKLEHLSKELQLSADQKAKLEAIFNEKHEKFRAIREESQNRIKEVLSAEQLTVWDAMKKRRHEKHHKMIENSL